MCCECVSTLFLSCTIYLIYLTSCCSQLVLSWEPGRMIGARKLEEESIELAEGRDWALNALFVIYHVFG
jgi:hypothetical protein